MEKTFEQRLSELENAFEDFSETMVGFMAGISDQIKSIEKIIGWDREGPHVS